MLAGSLTVATGPTFTPDTAFTNNTITLDTTVGAELIRILGGATITPPERNHSGYDHAEMAVIDATGRRQSVGGI